MAIPLTGSCERQSPLANARVLKVDFQPLVRQLSQRTLGPLYHQDTVDRVVAERQFGDLFRRGQAVEVGMVKSQAPAVLGDKDERRALDRISHVEAARQPLREARLATAQLASQQQHVARA